MLQDVYRAFYDAKTGLAHLGFKKPYKTFPDDSLGEEWQNPYVHMLVVASNANSMIPNPPAKYVCCKTFDFLEDLLRLSLLTPLVLLPLIRGIMSIFQQQRVTFSGFAIGKAVRKHTALKPRPLYCTRFSPLWQIIRADRGTEFNNKLVRDIVKLLAMKHAMSGD